MYDVIVIGAGPAGSSAAKALADSGRRVLLVEKFKMPRYKSCSGMLIKKTLDLVQDYFGESVPSAVTCAPAKNKGMVFTDDKGRAFRFEQEGLNVWRGSFDAWLARQAEKSGAQVRESTAVLSCEEREDFVTVTLRGEKTYTETARFVINCEGVVGVCKRKLTRQKQGYITTFQTFNEGRIDLDPHYFYAYLQPELSQYDAWFNVKDNQLVIGVSVKDTTQITPYYERFLSYLKKNHALELGRQLKKEKWLMPHIRPGCEINYGVGRVLFAGEAAGFLNPMGEGISAALESGWRAGQAVAGGFDQPAGVQEIYQQTTRELKYYMERQWSLVGAMAEPFREMKG